MSIAQELTGFLEAHTDDIQRGMQLPGLVLAKVTNVRDEKKLNRVKCLRIGADEKEETDWIHVMAPGGGQESGIFWFPRVGDLVILSYFNGDAGKPLVTGAVWNGDMKAPYTVEDEVIRDYGVKTPMKTEMRIHDEEKKCYFRLTTPGGYKLEMNEETEEIRLQDKEEKNRLLIRVKEGELEVKSEKKMTLSCGESSITLMKDGTIEMKGKKISIDGTNLSEKGSSDVKISGGSVDVTGQSGLNMSSASGQTVVKGSLVKIN